MKKKCTPIIKLFSLLLSISVLIGSTVPFIKSSAAKDIKQNKDGSLKNESNTLSRYIRDVYHHPENTNNAKYTHEELSISITEMRNFIRNKKVAVVSSQ